MDSIFDMLGFDTPDALKKEEKPAVKKAATKKPVKSIVTYPCTVCTWYGTFEIAEGEPTEKWLMEKISELCPLLPIDITNIHKVGDVYVITYHDDIMVAKGTLDDGINEETRLLRCDGTSVPVPEGQDLSKLEVPDIIKIFAEDSHTPIEAYQGVAYSTDSNVVVPVFEEGDDEVTSPEIEINIHKPSGEQTVISKEDFDAEGFEITKLDAFSKGKYAFKKLGTDTYLAILKGPATISTEKKEKQFKITDKTIISIGYQEFTPTPEDFGGKTKVTSKEIRQFLINKGRREFSVKDDISYETDKSGELIVCSILGSKKGAQPLAELSGSSLQSIPKEFLHSFYGIARAAYPNEVLVELFYIPSKEEWFYTIPPQKVGGASTECSYDRFLESFKMSGCVKVGEFHSHGRFPAFFSKVDDADEGSKKGIYGVIGDMGNDVPSLAFRYSDGTGKFDSISAQEFADEYLSDEAVLLNDPSNIITMYFENVVKFETERHTEEPHRWVEIKDNEVCLSYKPFERDYLRHIPTLELFEDVAVFRERVLESTEEDKLSFYGLYLKGESRNE